MTTMTNADENHVRPRENAGLEHRRFHRVPLRVPVSFSMLTGEGMLAVRWMGKTEDLTPAGLSLVVSRPVAVGDLLDLSIALFLPSQSATPHKIRTTGRVVHVTEREEGWLLVGAKFVTLSERDQVRFARFLFFASANAPS